MDVTASTSAVCKETGAVDRTAVGIMASIVLEAETATRTATGTTGNIAARRWETGVSDYSDAVIEGTAFASINIL